MPKMKRWCCCDVVFTCVCIYLPSRVKFSLQVSVFNKIDSWQRSLILSVQLYFYILSSISDVITNMVAMIGK